jgi:hypothetical protein
LKVSYMLLRLFGTNLFQKKVSSLAIKSVYARDSELNSKDNNRMLQAKQLQVEFLQDIAANAHNLRHFLYVVPSFLLPVLMKEPVYDRLHEKIEKFELLSQSNDNHKLLKKFARNDGYHWY